MTLHPLQGGTLTMAPDPKQNGGMFLCNYVFLLVRVIIGVGSLLILLRIFNIYFIYQH